MNKLALLGIDLGTSSVKVLLVDPQNGHVAGSGTAEYPIIHTHSGHAEQDPERWWQATIAAVGQARAAADQTPDVTAIGLSGQMHGTVLLDKNREPLGRAVIWPDQRSGAQVAEITRLIGAERLVELAGSPVASGFQAATVRWMQQNRPDLWGRVAVILAPKDYLRLRLTGELATDPSDGSGTLLLDARARDWSTELLDALDIGRNQLPPVRPSTAIAGRLSAPAADALCLNIGIPVVIGAADTACGVLGAGIVSGQDLLLTISTGGQIVPPCDDVRVDLRGRMHTFCTALGADADGAGWYQMAAILSAGMALRWLRDQVLVLDKDDAYVRMSNWASGVPAGANGLLFLPYLVGERTPHMDPNARGMFLGLTLEHDRSQLVRAVMEGVALACYDAYCVLEELGASPTRVIMAGGGSRSAVWRHIVADVFGVPVQQLGVAEQSAMGAALLAGAGTGLFDLVEASRSWVSYGPEVTPDVQQQAVYRSLLPIFRRAYRRHQEDFARLREICG